MDDAAGGRIDAHRRCRACSSDTAPFEISDVRRHCAEAGRRDAVGERSCELHDRRRPERESFWCRSHEGDRGHDVADRGDSYRARDPCRIRLPGRVDRQPEVADLREEQDERHRAERDRREIAARDPKRSLGAGGGHGSHSGDFVAEFVDRDVRVPKRGSSLAGQHERLQRGQRVEQWRRAECFAGAPNGQVCAHDGCAGSEQLRDVVLTVDVRCVESCSRQSDRHDSTFGGEEGARHRGAVSETCGVELLDHSPGGDKLRLIIGAESAKVVPVEPAAYESTFALGNSSHPDDVGNGDAVLRSKQVRERLVFDRVLRAAGVLILARVAKHDEAPGPVQPVGFAPVAVDDPDVQNLAVARHHAERTVLAPQYFDVANLEPLPGQPGHELLRIRKASRRAEHEMDRRSDDPAHREAADHIRREMRADVDPGDRNHRDQQPSSAPSRPVQVRARDRGHGGGDRDVRCRKRQAGRDGPVQQHARYAFVGWTLGDDRTEGFGDKPGSPSAEHDEACQPRAPTQHAHRGDDRDCGERTELHHTDQGRTRRIGELIDETEEIDLYPARIRRPGRDRSPDQDHDAERESKDIGRVPSRRSPNRYCRTGRGHGAKRRSATTTTTSRALNPYRLLISHSRRYESRGPFRRVGSPVRPKGSSAVGVSRLARRAAISARMARRKSGDSAMSCANSCRPR